MARFRALQSRAKTSSASNLTAAQGEAHRLANDPSQLAAVQRRAAVAGQKLLKADVEDAGGDFERKRAWDWTVDESERWDERQRDKAARRDDNAFSDFRREAGKVYERQLRGLGDPDLERYAADKMRAIEAAAARGSLEIVETEDGEMVAVDKDGTFYGGGGGSGDLISSFADNKPDKKAVDRLVAEMRKADEVSARKRRERAARNGDDADVTYINDKNSEFLPSQRRNCCATCCPASETLTTDHFFRSFRTIQPEAVALLQQVHGRDQGQFRAWHDDLTILLTGIAYWWLFVQAYSIIHIYYSVANRDPKAHVPSDVLSSHFRTCSRSPCHFPTSHHQLLLVVYILPLS